MLKVIFSKNSLTPFQWNLSQLLNSMSPVSVEVGGHLDRYAAKVNLTYGYHFDENNTKVLKGAACLRDGFCATCEVYAYDVDENGNVTACHMFKKPTSYRCDIYHERIDVEIEFNELHGGPNIDEECKEIENIHLYAKSMLKSLREKFDKNLKNEGDNKMKHFSEHSNMCATCPSKGHCMAGNCLLLQIARIQEEPDHLDFQLIKRRDVDNNSSDKNTKSEATERISKHDYYLKIAEAVSLRGTCLRRKFGAIIVKDDRIVSTGYVGAPRGRINCCDRGKCYRMEHNVPSGQRYELCRSTHAEMNAIIQASPEEMKYATLYLVGIENDGSYTNADCCSMCKRVIINSGINTVIARQADGSFKKIHVTEWINNDDSLDIDHEGY